MLKVICEKNQEAGYFNKITSFFLLFVQIKISKIQSQSNGSLPPYQSLFYILFRFSQIIFSQSFFIDAIFSLTYTLSRRLSALHSYLRFIYYVRVLLQIKSV